MRRWMMLSVLAFLVPGLAWWPQPARSQESEEANWIWFNEGDPVKQVPVAGGRVRYFRKVFKLDKPLDEATLEITADERFTVWINGVEIGKGADWKRIHSFDVKQHLVPGKNVLAVQADKSKDGPAGLLVRLAYVPNGQAKLAILSNGSWKTSKAAEDGWLKPGHNDSKWPAARVLGPVGTTGPWKMPAGAAGTSRFTVPPGFRVELAVKKPGNDKTFSLVNLTFDNKGRLLVSRENGPILLCTEPNKDGVFQTVKPYCEQVKNCQGMCWVRDALLLVGDGPQGTGLYRVRDTKRADKIDEVKLLHKFVGGMGEHGPHAILHGPDDWLYLVVGNHAWAKPDKLADNSPLLRWPNGQMGPDQGKPGTTEDVLLPRKDDARGHAVGIRAPGGTIWRLDHEGENMSLVAAGFRNHFDAAFSPTGELFTFDSDMEWDEGLPWYKPVRICHCPPGADFVWRTGRANTPDYYIDSLPSALDVGRGSPVGMEFYDHYVFPEKYRGACFMGDWSLGTIYAVFFERQGASYKAKVEKFCQGAPMNVTDVAVGPDGALYFVMGGRNSQGGVYRIVYKGATEPKPGGLGNGLDTPQPLSAWARRHVHNRRSGATATGSGRPLKWMAPLAQMALDQTQPSRIRIRAMTLLNLYPKDVRVEQVVALSADKSAEVRAYAVWLVGINGYKVGREVLVKALKDSDALVRRRACEALIRAGFEPPVEALWPLLNEDDRFVRTAARLVLQRIDPKKWTDRLWKEEKDLIAWEGIIALCKTNQASPYAEQVFTRLNKAKTTDSSEALLDYLRTIQMAMIHTVKPPGTAAVALADRCDGLFPHKDRYVNRELAILLTHFRRAGYTTKPGHAKLLDALFAARDDRQQQIHYFYCLVLLHEGWTPEQQNKLLAWYNETKGWKGGHSFAPYLANIFKDGNPIFMKKLPGTPAAMAEVYVQLMQAKDDSAPLKREILLTALLRSTEPGVQPALRRIADNDPAQMEIVARTLARSPSAENWPYLVRGLDSANPLTVFAVIEALKKQPTKPKPEDATAYRQLILASKRLDEKSRWKVVELLRHWTGDKRFGAEQGDWKAELASWSKWYSQTFPREPALPDVAADKLPQTKYKLDNLLAYLEKDPRGQKGDGKGGRAVFEKAQCMKCHKHGTEGDSIGPDLTTVSKRFKRADMLEKIMSPSKVISDQYRSTLIVLKTGQQIEGLVAPQGNTLTVLKSDGTKVMIQKDEIEQQVASLVSLMPTNLLDALTKEEIADLFAFLESEPPK